MATAQELRFILRMKEDASAAFRRVAGEMGGTKQQADGLQKSLKNIVAAAAEATVALGGIRTSTAGLSKVVGDFNQFELGLINIQKTTNYTAEQMKVLRGELDDVSKAQNGISTQRIQELAAASAQLGVKNIAEFTKAMGELEVSTDISGAQGAADIARILNITGEGAGAIRKFGDALSFLGNNTAAFESDIINVASVLARTTSPFKVAANDVLALSSAAKELDLNPDLFGGAAGRVLRSLKDAVLNNTKGFDQYALAVGQTREQFQDLIKNDPAQVLIDFADVLGRTNKAGGSATAMLTELNLNTDEVRSVFEAAGARIDIFQNKLKLIRSGKSVGALAKESAQFFGAQANVLKGLQKAALDASTAVGESLAPLTNPALRGATSVLNELVDSFKGLPAPIKTTASALGLLLPTLVGGIAAFRLFNRVLGVTTALTTVRVGITALGVAMGAASPIAVALAAAIGTVIAAMSLEATANAIGDWISYNLSDENRERVRSFIEPMRDLLDLLQTDITTGIIGGGPNAGKSFFGEDAVVKLDTVIVPPDPAELKKMRDYMSTKVKDDNFKVELPVQFAISPEQETALKQLDQYRDGLAQVAEQQKALNALRALPEADRLRAGGTEEEIARLQKLIDLSKQRLDPVFQVTREMQDQTADANAITVAQKNQLEITRAIRDVLEQTGSVSAAQAADITKSVQDLQAARNAAGYAEYKRSLDDALGSSQALGRSREIELQVVQAIAEQERTIGTLTAERRAEIEKTITTTKQLEAFKGLQTQLQPQISAVRDYGENVLTLKAALDAGAISASQFDQMLSELNRQTEGQRNPYLATVKSMREALDLAKVQGRYTEADRNVIRTTNQLRDLGLQVTEEMVSAIREYERAMQDVSKGNGFDKFAESVGTVKENLDGLQEDFASGLSDAITDGLTGNKASIQEFLASFSKQVLNVAVKQLVANTLKSFGGGEKKDPMIARADAALAKLDALSKAGINTQTATIQAGQVMINGQNIGAPANENGIGAVGTVTRGGPLPDIGSGNSVSMAANLLKKKEGFREKPYWDVNALRVGYGSDTTTDPSTGRVSKVTSATRVTREMADADLERRIGQFQQTIVKQVGPEAFKALGDQAKAALTSTAYNYGSLPNSVAGAVRGGNTESIASALEGLKGHNGGINANRRQQEADLVRASQSIAQVGTAAQTTSQQVQQATTAVQASGAANQNVASSTSNAALAVKNLGQAGQQAAPAVDQASTALQNAGTKAATVTPSVGNVGNKLNEMGGSVGNLAGTVAQAIPGFGQFGGIISQVISTIFGSLGGGGGAGAGFGGLASTVLGFLHHDGGTAGASSKRVPIPTNALKSEADSSQKFKSDEYPALLRRGERVLTKDQDQRNTRLLENAANSNGGGQNVQQTVRTNFSPTISISMAPGSTGNKDDDKAQAEMISKAIDASLQQRMAAFVQDQMRPGNSLSQRKFQS